MGGKSSTLVIKIDQQYGVPGETLTGRVYLDVRVDSVDAESLILRFVGEERSHIYRRSTKRDLAWAEYVKFLDTAYPLSSQGNFSRGQYEYPFSIPIPTGLNQSMSEILNQEGEDGKYGTCWIFYYLEAKLHRRGWLKWNVQTKIPLTMIQRPVEFTGQFPAYVSPVSHQITTWCCKRGEMIVGLHTPTAYLKPGDTFQVSYLLQNSSPVSIRAIEIEVYEKVKWTAQGVSCIAQIPVMHRRLEGRNLQLDTTPLTTYSQHPNGRIGELIADERVLAQLKQVLDSRKYSVSATMGSTTRAQMKSSLIEVNHYLTMKVCTPFGTNNPFVYTEVTVQPHVNALAITPAVSRRLPRSSLPIGDR